MGSHNQSPNVEAVEKSLETIIKEHELRYNIEIAENHFVSFFLVILIHEVNN